MAGADHLTPAPSMAEALYKPPTTPACPSPLKGSTQSVSVRATVQGEKGRSPRQGLQQCDDRIVRALPLVRNHACITSPSNVPYVKPSTYESHSTQAL